MKLQKAFFLVLGLAFLVSLGSLVSGTPGQKAQTITSVTSSNSRLSVDRLSNSDSLRNVGTNSILLTSPSVSTSVSPNQTLPMTCEITVESGFRVFDLVFAAYSPATGEVVFHHEDNVSFADGAYSVDVTIPSTASEYIVMNCVAEYWNPDSSQYRQIASNYPVNVTRTTQPPVSTAPTAPSNLSGSATGQTSANITWSDNSNNETSFTLQRATNTSFTAGLTTLSPSANATSQSITGLAAGTTYYFRIQANNGSLSSGWSNVATVTTTSAPTNDTTAPSRPGGMTSSNRTSYQIQVNWTPSTDNVAVAGYYLYRNNGGSTSVNNTTPIATISPNQTSYTDVGLQSSKGYRYRLRAFDAAGNLSNWGLVGTSNTATTLTASTLAVTMPASSSVTVTNATSSSLQVNWSPSTSGEIFDYKVYANNGGSTAINTTTPVGIISTNPSSSSYCFQNNKFCFVHTGLNASTTYKYQVAASDPANNNSNRTSAKSGTTLAGGGTGPVAPTAPSNLSGSATGQTSANITWSDNSNNETSFTLQRATNTSFTAGLTTLSPSANATSQSITGLAAGTTYYFRIQANNGSLSSGWSNVATLVMPAVQNPPSAPTGVSVGSPTTSSLTVSWSAVADTTSYKVYRVLSSGIVDMAVPPVVVPVPNLSTTITNLSSGTAYRFLVTANNAAGESTLTPTGSGASANNATGTTSSPQITVSSLSLVRTDGTVIESLDGGESINVGTQNGGVGVNISVKANTVPATAGSVVFTLQRPNSTVYNLTENQAPYTLFGDSGDTTIVAWQNLILGGYTLTVTPYAGANGTGQVGVPRTVQFQIVNNDDSTPPVNPTNVLVTYRSANQIKLGWTNSTSTDVASYRVHRDNVSVGVVNHPTNTFTDTTVNGTSNYAYKVISIDTSNNEATLPSTASNAPTLSTAFALNNQVETNTNAQVKSAPESATVAGTQASGSIGTITNGPVWVVGGVQYWYVNFNSGTDGWVNETNLDIYTAPTTDTSSPTYPNGNASFTVSAGSQTSLVLDWADATDLTPPVTYKVSRSTVSTGPFYQVAPAFTASTFTDTEGGALTAGTTRYYQLVACDAVTPTQNCTTAITASGTTSPVTDNTAPVVTITAPAQNEVLPSNTTSTTLTVSTNEPATCKWSTTNTTYGNMTNTMSGSGSTSHSLAITVASGTSYTRYVACSDSSNNASTTQGRDFSVATFVPDTSAPTGSLGVTVGSPTATSLTISWNALTDATPPINYRLYRSSTQTGTYTQVGGNITGTSYVDSGRSASTTYWYKVDACDSVSPTANCTSQSTAVSGTTADVGTEPPITTTCPTLNTVDNRIVTKEAVQLCAEVSNSPNRITLKWANVSGRTQSSATISRKSGLASTSWTQIGTVSGSATSYVDNTATSGTYYEYKVQVNSNGDVAYGYIASGINVPLESYKGKMVLVIDNTFQTSLASQINTLIDDLTGDRWVVIPKYVSRNDTPTAVRNVIKTEYDADPTNVKAVYLLGKIPVPRAGNFNGDGHGSRAISTDTYYGEMTQEFNKLSNNCSPYTELANIPAGPTDWSLWPVNYSQWQTPYQVSSFMPIPPTTHKFCLSSGQTPSALELQVGRVDMSNLTVYSQSEQTLLSNYLTKAREFKRKVWTPQKRAFLRDALQDQSGGGWIYDGGKQVWGTIPSIVGPNSITRDDSVSSMSALNIASSSSNTYLFTSLRYGGTSTASDYTGGNALGNSYVHASSGFDMGGVFNQYVASYITEWGDYNALIRAALADGKALVSMSAVDRGWYLQSMGMGQNIGYAGRMSVNNNTSSYVPVGGIWNDSYGGNGFMTLLGDPSLRAEYIAPVSSLTLSNSGGKTAMSWPAAASATHGYNVYKITSSSITKLNGSPITGTSFTSTDNYTSGNKYMVTAVKLEITNSGTYYNESLGAIATVGGTVVGDTTPPSVPTNLAITNTSQNMVSLSWTASSDAVGVSGYNIFRSDTQSGTYVQKNDGPINSTSYNDFSVSPSNTYYYKVSAFDVAGNQSNQSSSVSATTPSAPSGSQVLGINGAVGPNLTDNATSCTNPSGGRMYYVDSVAGNDLNTGDSPSSPWKTISKLNTASFSAGTMACFKRGGVYPGTITLSVSGTQSAPIRFDAYGSGAAPIISGFDQVTTPWVTYSGNIWKTTIATGLKPEQLQVAGVVQNLARHPNTGWLQTTNKTSTTASGTWIGTQAANSLVGANIIEYANPWAWFKGQVTANSGSTVTFTPGAAIFDGDQAGWSYGLENKLSFLDSAGEWYYNNTTGELYFWAPGNANPNNLSIEISARDEGIYMTGAGARDTQFKNLVFEGYSGTVVSYGDQRRNVYENLEIRKSGKAIGVWSQATSATDGVLIKNNYIHNIYKDGIYFVGGNGQTIEGNVIKDIGIDPWYAGSGSSWSMIAINTGTSNQVIRRNIIENIGYTGIFVNGSGVVEENHLKNMLVSVTDGAAIMFNIADGLSIRKNIIEEVYSQNMSAMPLPYPTYPPNGISNGIYYGDDTIQNTTVENNVVANVGNDAYVMDHGNEYINNRTINNIGFNFGRGGIFFSDASIYRDIGPSYGASYMQLCLPYENSACFRPQFNDIVTGNKLYGSKPDQLDASGRNGSRGIYMFYVYSNGTGAHVDYGTINNNYYYNRLSANRVTTRWPVIGPFTTTDYTMSAWRTFSGEDANSTESTYPASSTRPEPDIYLNPTASPITRSVNGCTSNNTPLTGVQTIQPFSALVVEYGNC